MKSFFDQLAGTLALGDTVAVATIVGTSGPVPREVGAKMAVGEEGVLAGTVGGGAGEAAVCRIAREVLADGRARRVSIPLAPEDAGLSPAAAIAVFLDPWPGPAALALAEGIRDGLAAGRAVALATVVRSEGAGDWPIGRKVLITGAAAQGQEPATAAALRAAAVPALTAGQAYAALHTIPADDPAASLLAATIEILVEVFVPPLTLLLVGAGHIAQPLAAIAKLLGYEVMVLDDRPALANAERFPGADRLLIGDPAALLRDYPITPRCHVLLAPPDHAQADACLREVIGSAASYVGLVASKRRAAALRAALAEAGIPADRLSRLHSPAGLAIGARTPAAIAVSIAAELVQVHYATFRCHNV